MANDSDITIIIPTCGRCEHLAGALAALERQTIGAKTFEVIVVNDGGPEIKVPLPASLRTSIFYQKNQGPAAARNHGAKNAETPLIAFLDDDCEPDPTWLAEMRKVHDGQPGRLVAGRTLNGLENNIYAASTQVMVDHLMGLPVGDTSDPETILFAPSCNLLCAKDDFFSLGSFDPSFPLAAGEDRMFCDQWRESGDIQFAPQAIVRHHHRLDFRGYCRQHLNYGRGARQYHARKNKKERTSPNFYINLLRRPFRTPIGRPMAASVLLLIAQIQTARGRLVTFRR